MSYETLDYQVRDGILTLTLNRPDRMNAFNAAMCRELITAFDAADADDAVRVVVMTGAGKAFCAGADLEKGGDTFNRHTRQNEPEGDTLRDGGGMVSLRIYECTKPVIGAFNGAAVGVGATMTLPMDIRMASTKARFGFVFARRGITMEACSSWFLPRLVGPMQAAEWVYTGRVFDAEEALKGGLIRSIHEPDELLPAAYALAREIANNTSGMSALLNRQLLWRMMGADHPMEAHKVDSRAIAFMGESADAQEGVQSFLEKRPPQFKLSPSQDRPAFYPWWNERPFK
jgi:enoyl-CoA hydratase/carnithine racemase